MTSITECWYNHTPPIEEELEERELEFTIDEKTPKGVAGWTLLTNMLADPTTFGIIITTQWYIDMCSLIATYEDFYFEQMEDIATLFGSLSDTCRSKAATMTIHQDIYNLIDELDEEYFDVAEACADLIPSSVWLAYTGLTQR